MANKRNLKKQIKYICGDIASESVLAIQFMPNIDQEKMANVINDIAKLQFATLEHLTFSFDKSPRDFADAKAYKKARAEYFKKAYDSVRKEFNEKVEAIVKEMNAALPKKGASSESANA